MINLSKYRIIDLFARDDSRESRKSTGTTYTASPFSAARWRCRSLWPTGPGCTSFRARRTMARTAEGAYKIPGRRTGHGWHAIGLVHWRGRGLRFFRTRGQEEGISADEFRQAGVKSGDIVLKCAPTPNTAASYPTLKPMCWISLLKRGSNCWLRAVVCTTVHPLYPTPTSMPSAGCWKEGIPMVDALLGLEQLTKDRVFFIALPLKMQRVTASWTRAIALEEID